MPRSHFAKALIAASAILALFVPPVIATAAGAVPSVEPNLVPVADPLCFDYPLDAMPLDWFIDLSTVAGPLGGRYGLPGLNERAESCFHDATLTVTAFSAAPEGLGGAVPYLLAPAWLDTWGSRRWFLATSAAEAPPGAPAGPFLAVAVPPALQARFDALRGQWVIVRFHFDDPAAMTCRIEGGGAPDGRVIPSQQDLAALCRQSPVVSSVEAAGCPSRPRSVVTFLAVAEAIRAFCFGKGAIEFDARGGSANNVWPGVAIPDGITDWFLADADGRRLAVFVPTSIKLPDPTGTPWENSDGTGGPDVWWHVRAHLDDPLASGCRGGGPDTFEGPDFQVTLQRSDEQAIEFCRNHLVVDSLTWLLTPPTDADDSPDQGVAGRLGWMPAVTAILMALAVLLAPRRPTPDRRRATDGNS